MKQEREKPSYVIVDSNAPGAVLQRIRKLLVEKLLYSNHAARNAEKEAGRQ